MVYGVLALGVNLCTFNMTPFTLKPLNAGTCQLLDAHGQHVGYLKLINALWKFKAVGYGPQGEVIPGGGPLTDRHNTTFVRLDAAEIEAELVRAVYSTQPCISPQ